MLVTAFVNIMNTCCLLFHLASPPPLSLRASNIVTSVLFGRVDKPQRVSCRKKLVTKETKPKHISPNN